MWRRVLFFMVLAFLSLAQVVEAQPPDLSQVTVTTQDYASLRAGPGRHWDRLAVLPYGATYRATGRTIDADWIQIAYEGELETGARTEFTQDGITYGWVAYWLLTWTGNILELPIDGVKSVPIARSAGPTIIIGPGNQYIYTGSVGTYSRVASPTSSPVKVEVTGRLGSTDAGYFWLQFKIGGRYYWIPTWETGVPVGYWQTPDAAYLYSYGRLLLQLRSEINRAYEVLNDIGGRWRALAAGQATTCIDIPEDFRLRRSSFSPLDLNREPIYAPTADALVNGRDSINAALGKFRQVCQQTGEDRLVRAEDMRSALDDVDAADRYLTIANTLLTPLERRDPLLSN
jgi:hypothetical protein